MEERRWWGTSFCLKRQSKIREGSASASTPIEEKINPVRINERNYEERFVIGVLETPGETLPTNRPELRGTTSFSGGRYPKKGGGGGAVVLLGGG